MKRKILLIIILVITGISARPNVLTKSKVDEESITTKSTYTEHLTSSESKGIILSSVKNTEDSFSTSSNITVSITDQKSTTPASNNDQNNTKLTLIIDQNDGKPMTEEGKIISTEDVEISDTEKSHLNLDEEDRYTGSEKNKRNVTKNFKDTQQGNVSDTIERKINASIDEDTNTDVKMRNNDESIDADVNRHGTEENAGDSSNFDKSIQKETAETTSNSNLLKLLEKQLNESYSKYLDELDKVLKSDLDLNDTAKSGNTTRKSIPQFRKVILLKDDMRFTPRENEMKTSPNSLNIIIVEGYLDNSPAAANRSIMKSKTDIFEELTEKNMGKQLDFTKEFGQLKKEIDEKEKEITEELGLTEELDSIRQLYMNASPEEPTNDKTRLETKDSSEEKDKKSDKTLSHEQDSSQEDKYSYEQWTSTENTDSKKLSDVNRNSNYDKKSTEDEIYFDESLPRNERTQSNAQSHTKTDERLKSQKKSTSKLVLDEESSPKQLGTIRGSTKNENVSNDSKLNTNKSDPEISVRVSNDFEKVAFINLNEKENKEIQTAKAHKKIENTNEEKSAIKSDIETADKNIDIREEVTKTETIKKEKRDDVKDTKDEPGSEMIEEKVDDVDDEEVTTDVIINKEQTGKDKNNDENVDEDGIKTVKKLEMKYGSYKIIESNKDGRIEEETNKTVETITNSEDNVEMDYENDKKVNEEKTYDDVKGIRKDLNENTKPEATTKIIDDKTKISSNIEGESVNRQKRNNIEDKNNNKTNVEPHEEDKNNGTEITKKRCPHNHNKNGSHDITLENGTKIECNHEHDSINEQVQKSINETEDKNNEKNSSNTGSNLEPKIKAQVVKRGLIMDENNNPIIEQKNGSKKIRKYWQRAETRNDEGIDSTHRNNKLRMIQNKKDDVEDTIHKNASSTNEAECMNENTGNETRNCHIDKKTSDTFENSDTSHGELSHTTKNVLKNKGKTWQNNENQTYPTEQNNENIDNAEVERKDSTEHIKDNIEHKKDDKIVEITNLNDRKKINSKVEKNDRMKSMKDERRNSNSEEKNIPVNKEVDFEKNTRTNSSGMEKTDEIIIAEMVPIKKEETHEIKVSEPVETEIDETGKMRTSNNQKINLSEANRKNIDETSDTKEDITDKQIQERDRKQTSKVVNKSNIQINVPKLNRSQSPEENISILKNSNISVNNNSPITIVDFQNLSQIDSLLYSLLPLGPHLVSVGIKIISIQENDKEDKHKNYESRAPSHYRYEQVLNEKPNKNVSPQKYQMDNNEEAVMDIKVRPDVKYGQYLEPLRSVEPLNRIGLRKHYRLKREPLLQKKLQTYRNLGYGRQSQRNNMLKKNYEKYNKPYFYKKFKKHIRSHKQEDEGFPTSYIPEKPPQRLRVKRTIRL